jgi:alpha-ketoglutaric semialdehyde dehydrogenase
MQITGNMLIGGADVSGLDQVIQAVNPFTNEVLVPEYRGASNAQLNEAVLNAQAAFETYSATSPDARADFLEVIAEEIMKLGDVLLERAQQETGLPIARLTGERARTVNQLKLFASVVREGDWLGVRIDHAQPSRTPQPRSDIRMRHIPVGPVAVFGASNFPLAFSVGGGDTASALAAGAPVVVKGHSAHLGTSELVGRAIQNAVKRCNLHSGVFSLVFDSGYRIGQCLVAHPAIKAVGFTGSRTGGLALMQTAASRSVPIPVYAEMSSINPVFLLPEALKQRAEEIARGFAASLTGSAGQLCTNPGLIVGIDSPELDAFIATASTDVKSNVSTTMLTPGIHQNYQEGVARLEQHADVTLTARGDCQPGSNQCQAALFSTTAAAFIKAPETLGAEVFGACSLVVRCANADEMLKVVSVLEGQLTATLHMDSLEDSAFVRRLIVMLESKVGRILANGFPTGVEVGHAMVHGGPFPSTSDGRSTSVGSTAIFRWLRPVAYQDIAEAYLPVSLQDANPWNVPRREDR